VEAEGVRGDSKDNAIGVVKKNTKSTWRNEEIQKLDKSFKERRAVAFFKVGSGARVLVTKA